MRLRNLIYAAVIGTLLAMSMFAQPPQTAPVWARGTWNWVEGSDRTMVISNNGTIALSTGGTTSYGVYNGGKIYLNGNASTMTHVGSNLRTYNQSTGETSNYAHPASSGAPTSTPPSWMVGTWYWTQGEDRTMTIDNTGHVTLLTSGMTSQGTWYNNRINLNGNLSTANHIGTNMRTRNLTTNETSDYSKSPFDDGNESLTMEPPPAWTRKLWLKDGSPMFNGITIRFFDDGKVDYSNAGVVTHGRYVQGYVKLGIMSLKLDKFGSKLRLKNESNGNNTDFGVYPMIHFP